MSTRNAARDLELKDLIAKYDVPVPRYTSYPTVPYWETPPTTPEWLSHVQKAMTKPDASWSLYLHIPYCETLCTFCGCNNTITKDHKKEDPYVDTLLHEWALYLASVPELATRPLRHLHLGGGTPTFLSAANLKRLLEPLLEATVHDPENFQAAIEVDPRRTTREQLEVLRELGFNRLSLGVQDFNPEVQRLVNRVQPYEITKKITDDARELGYDSVNFDLIYGLAKQTRESMIETAKKTIELKPDRIALYSFARVPWIKPQQRLFKDEDLPKAEEKRELYEVSRQLLLEAGYVEVGMDHFALPTDGLALAMKQGDLHRNFMGYTDVRTDLLLGLGVSSISETPSSFHQNEKIIGKYSTLVEGNQIPTLRGHTHTREDQELREQILQLMTKGEVKVTAQQETEAREFLKEMLEDGLVILDEQTLSITSMGKPFLRNACLFFDQRLRRQAPQTKLFSQSI